MELTNKIVMDKDGKEYPLYNCPLWWHDKGLSQTASGYGKKLTTRYKVLVNGRFYRMYCRCFSNVGTCYILTKDGEIILN